MKIVKKHSCLQCGEETSKPKFCSSSCAGKFGANLLWAEHIKVNKPWYKKVLHCKYCGLSFENFNKTQKANHTRWCKLNPKLQQHLDFLSSIRKKRKVENRSNTYIKAKKEGNPIPVSPNKGKKLIGCGKGKTAELEKIRIEKIRSKALLSNHRRLIRHTRKYHCKNGSIVLLDSSWEEMLAIRLDFLNINWVRPKPIRWKDKIGKFHNYFPDFYLIDYGIYLDTKNLFVQEIQKEKLDIISKQIPKLIFLTTKEECKNYVPVLTMEV